MYALRISEKTVELSFCSQLSVQLNRSMVWFGLTQHQEAQAGFDACTRLNARIVLLQFKASSRDVGGKRRFTAKHDQLQRLQTWCAFPLGVYYVFPLIGTTAELNANPDFISTSWLLDVRALPTPMPPPTTRTGSLRRNGIHYVDVVPGIATIHSDPFDVKLIELNALYESTLRATDTEQAVQSFEMRRFDNLPKAFWRNAVAVGFMP